MKKPETMNDFTKVLLSSIEEIKNNPNITEEEIEKLAHKVALMYMSMEETEETEETEERELVEETEVDNRLDLEDIPSIKELIEYSKETNEYPVFDIEALDTSDPRYEMLKNSTGVYIGYQAKLDIKDTEDLWRLATDAELNSKFDLECLSKATSIPLREILSDPFFEWTVENNRSSWKDLTDRGYIIPFEWCEVSE